MTSEVWEHFNQWCKDVGVDQSLYHPQSPNLSRIRAAFAAGWIMGQQSAIDDMDSNWTTKEDK